MRCEFCDLTGMQHALAAKDFGCGDLRIVVDCPTLAAIDASSGGGLPHLRFSTALFAVARGNAEPRGTILYRPIGGGKWPAEGWIAQIAW